MLTLPMILTSMDITILHIAIPTLTHELEPSASQTLWILDAYGFLLAGLLIMMGNIGDRIGRRRLLLIGATVFGGASALAARPRWRRSRPHPKSLSLRVRSWASAGLR